MAKIVTPDDFLFDLANNASSGIYQSVCTLFSMKKGIFDVVGSGILFSFGDDLYIVSASHVFDQIGQLFLPIKGVIAPVNGELWSGDTAKVSPDHRDVLDVAVFKINQSHNEDMLDTYRAFSNKDILVNHIDSKKNFYLIVANTQSKTRYDRDNQVIKTESFSYVGTLVDDEQYLKNSIPKKYFMIINYNRKRVKRDDGYVKGPLPFGMSGSGLWYLDKIWENKPSFKLVGILVEYRESSRIIIAIRSFILTELLRNKLKIEFPESKEARFGYD